MDLNTIALILAAAVAVVLIVVVAVLVNFVIDLRRAKNAKKVAEGDIAKWLTVRDNHTRDIASLRAELSSLKNAKNGDLKDTQRIWDRIKKLEEDLAALKDKPAPRRSRRDDYDEDEEEDDRYARPAPRRRSTGGYR